MNCERDHCLVMKPPILPFQTFQFSLILQLISSVESVDTPPVTSSPPVTPLLNGAFRRGPPLTPLLSEAFRKDPPVKPLLTSSLARSAAELTCDHRLYQVKNFPSDSFQQISNYESGKICAFHSIAQHLFQASQGHQKYISEQKDK